MRSFYSEILILRLKAALCVADLCGAETGSSHKLASFGLQKKLGNETSESVDGSLQTEQASLKFITKTKHN